jgi:glyoxylase-like metal-dependent hydrolase (beta-lactamase superfamily II)
LPVASSWFERWDCDRGVTGFTEPHVNPFVRSNAWHVRGSERDLLVDAGLGVASMARALGALIDKPVLAVATHTHYDHVGGLHEFEQRAVHELEAMNLADPVDGATLVSADLGEDFIQEMAGQGYLLGELLIDALPHDGYDPRSFTTVPTTPTMTLADGDTIDLGDRVFEVIHLPGHSPGSIGLWEPASGVLFSGDVVYSDGRLLDELPGSSIPDYLETMDRLVSLPVTTVHGGHAGSFGREELLRLIDAYRSRRASVPQRGTD